MDDPIPPTVSWCRGTVRLIDQRELPARLCFVECATVDEVCDAIRCLVVRGAPALGATGAFGVALAARTLSSAPAVRGVAQRLVATRPTAVNLAWGVEQAMAAWEGGGADVALAEAKRIAAADVEANRALGRLGAELVPEDARVYTHCNGGSLACVGYGTALGVVRAAVEVGKKLDRLGIPCTLVADVMAGSLMASDEVDLVVVGADRIAANGDVANKIGTYPLAVLAERHGVPFYVAAPTSTIDLAMPDGAAIPVEERDPREVLEIAGKRVAPEHVGALNRAFDVTPARLVAAIVTEQGVLRPPYDRSLRASR